MASTLQTTSRMLRALDGVGFRRVSHHIRVQPAFPRPSQRAIHSQRPSLARKDTIMQRWHTSLQSFPRHLQSSILRRLQQIRSYSTPPKPNPTPQLGSPQPSLTLSQRMKKLSREYGWTAVGVYLGLSALDFPFCFLAVRLLGTDRIGHWEHVVVETVKNVVWYPLQSALAGGGGDGTQKAVEEKSEPAAAVTYETLPGAGWGVEEAEKANASDATLATQLALAYAIHKSFIFIRVPLTAAVLPKVVKTLRGWGWDIGKRKPKTPGASKTK